MVFLYLDIYKKEPLIEPVAACQVLKGVVQVLLVKWTLNKNVHQEHGPVKHYYALYVL